MSDDTVKGETMHGWRGETTDLTGRAALIIGASGGIGCVTARRHASCGADAAPAIAGQDLDVAGE